MAFQSLPDEPETILYSDNFVTLTPTTLTLHRFHLTLGSTAIPLTSLKGILKTSWLTARIWGMGPSGTLWGLDWRRHYFGRRLDELIVFRVSGFWATSKVGTTVLDKAAFLKALENARRELGLDSWDSIEMELAALQSGAAEGRVKDD